MSTREEVKDSVITNIVKACPRMLNKNIVELADKILKDEAAQGVVIAIKGIPAETIEWFGRKLIKYTTEPLIKK